jgi:fido (protein-threonine AMPylation protein)
MSAEETWLEAANRLRRVLADVEDEARRRPVAMTGDRICRWHRAIFLTTFERDAGRPRSDHEPVWFVVKVKLGERPMGRRLIEGTSGRSEIERQLEVACERFDAVRRSIDERRAATPVKEAIGIVTGLYVDLLRIHPFVDGNLRAAFVALQAGLRSLRLPGVSFGRVLDRHDEAIGWAIRDDEYETEEPLTDLILELIALD